MKSVAVYVVGDSVGKLCSLTVQLDLLWAAETSSKSWTGQTHIKTFLQVLSSKFFGDVGCFVDIDEHSVTYTEFFGPLLNSQ